MKRLSKIMLLVSGICGALGVVFLIAGLVLGVSTAQFWNSLKVNIPHLFFWEDGEEGRLEELADLSDLSDLSDLDLTQLVPEGWTVLEFEEIDKLQIEMDAGAVQTEQYDGETVQVCIQGKDSRIQAEQDGSRLSIQQEGRGFFRRNSKAVKLYIPRDLTFEKVELDLGAAAFYSDGLQADEISAEIGTGELDVQGRVQARKSSWEVATGAVTLDNLDCRDTELETGVGSMDVVLDGSQEDYSLDGKLGLGSLEFGDYTGATPGEHEWNQNAERRVKATCGVGDIMVTFTE